MIPQLAIRSLVGQRDIRVATAASTAISNQLAFHISLIDNLAREAAATGQPEATLAGHAHLTSSFDAGIALLTAEGDLVFPDYSDASQTLDPARLLARLHSQDTAPSRARFLSLEDVQVPGEPLMLAVSAPQDGLVAVGAFTPRELIEGVLDHTFGTDQEAVAFVAGPDGRILYDSGAAELHEAPLAQHVGIQEALLGASGTTFIDLAAREHVVAYSAIEPVGWALVVEEPWQTVSDPLLRAVEWAPLVLATGLALALFLLWLGTRTIVQPLQALAQMATALGSGHFQAIEEPVGGIFPIRQLQSALIEMAHKVRSAQHRLRHFLTAVSNDREEERRRLARSIHDQTIQDLIAVTQQLHLARQAQAEDASSLDIILHMTEEIISNLRRTTRALRPTLLDDFGLVRALERLAQEYSQFHSLPVHFEQYGTQQRFPEATELSLFRIVQEALTNVVRHAEATEAAVQLKFASDLFQITVSDNGRGFEAADDVSLLARLGHYGLIGIQERADAIGARLNINSAPGQGTVVTISLHPLLDPE